MRATVNSCAIETFWKRRRSPGVYRLRAHGTLWNDVRVGHSFPYQAVPVLLLSPSADSGGLVRMQCMQSGTDCDQWMMSPKSLFWNAAQRASG